MASLSWDGLDDVHQYLAELPSDLGQAGGALASRAATEAAFAIEAAYRRRSGHLANSTIVREKVLEFGLRARVTNTAAYVYAYETGRRKGTGRDGRYRGTTPASPTFIPIREKYQRSLQAALRALLEAHDLTVTGSDE